MLSWLGNIFNARPQTPSVKPGDAVPPGLKVALEGENAVGTVSAFVAGPNGTRARVIFVDPDHTWIQNVSLHRIPL